MFQLMIVDDEYHVVERFSTTIDWLAMDFKHVHKAYSGDEALSILNQFSIDVVITDIQMPGINGLQLIAEIKKKWPKTKCILLSGHADFDYAREAILHDTMDYLLKPVTEEVLLASVKRVLDVLREEWEDVISLQSITHTLKENLPLLRANLLMELIQGYTMPESSLKRRMHMLDLPVYYNNSFAIMMIRLEEYFLDVDIQSLSLMEYAIDNMTRELFGEKLDVWYTKDDHDYLVFVMKDKAGMAHKTDPKWFERTATQLQAVVKNYLKGKISVLISQWGSFPIDLQTTYNLCVTAFRTRIGSEHELFMRVEDGRTPLDIQSLHRLYEPPSLKHLLEAGRWDSLNDKLTAIFEELENKWSESQEHLLEVYYTLTSAYTYIAHSNGRQLSVLIGDDYSKMIDGSPFRSVNQLRDWSFRTLQKIKEDMDQETKDSRMFIINQIRSFIEQNLENDVSLQAIANHVHLHPVYVSKVYKLETTENLSDYVQQVRMDKAAYLLKNTQDKIYTVASQLGYQRPHSFNHAFKKNYGVTPQEYREQYKSITGGE